ncbi:MAG: ribbon-helix-helix protein, CopG family [Alphaproteobacteria bacterium]|nr:ribbon-helix-helix protein, CopG family [Alphaproteobacteria bacterium]
MKMRSIEVDAATAKILKARAAKRGTSVAEIVADLLKSEELPKDLAEMKRKGQGPWSPSALAEDARLYEAFKRTRMGVPWDEVRQWVESWGTADELPMPKPRKL